MREIARWGGRFIKERVEWEEGEEGWGKIDVLDFGCGTGNAGLELIDVAKSWTGLFCFVLFCFVLFCLFLLFNHPFSSPKELIMPPIC